MEERRIRRLDRFGQFSIAAARLAIDDSALDLAREDKDMVGATMGTALGGIGYAEEQYPRYLRDGPRGVDPALALTVFAGAASCNLAIEFGGVWAQCHQRDELRLRHHGDWRRVPRHYPGVKQM